MLLEDCGSEDDETLEVLECLDRRLMRGLLSNIESLSLWFVGIESFWCIGVWSGVKDDI